MEQNRMEQKEALETMIEFNTRLVKNMKIITKELSGERLEDTDIFLEDIIKAINWEIQVVNGTRELLDEVNPAFDKGEFNAKIVALNDAVGLQEDEKLATAFKEAVPVFEGLGKTAEKAILL